MRKNISAFFIGAIFSLGLGISQVTRPPKILGFLNVFGNWDPTLIVVFVGAIMTYLLFYYFIIQKSVRESLEEKLKGKEKIEARVVIGALVFGIGWGLIGLCPGPAITDLVSGKLTVITFVIGMILGIYVMKGAEKKIL